MPPAKPKQGKRDAASRWTPALVEEGYTPISNFFLWHANELRPEITGGETLFVIHLMTFKWDKEMPFPGYITIAKRMRIGHPQARKLARGLQRKGYLIRHMRENQPNKFDLQPLFEKLEELRNRKIAEKKARVAKHRPKKY
jgi:hypothetical protein